MQTCVVLVLFCLAIANGQYNIQPPDMSLINPQGLRMSIPDEVGVTLFAVHYSINTPVPGVSPGDWNVDISQPTGDEWVHENIEVVVVPGDTVYFWHYVIHDGIGHQLLEQSWVAEEPMSTTTPEPTPAPTTPEPTPAPTTPEPTPAPTTPVPTTAEPTTAYTGSTPEPTPTPSPSPTTTTPSSGEECVSFPCLIFEDEFDSLNFDNWQHEITAGGGGNWEFQHYTNNRSNSYVKDGTLYIKPTTTEDKFGDGFLASGNLEIWGNTVASECTGNNWFGCQRTGTPTNYINPIQSARLRSVYGFNFRYGKIEVEAQLPKGDWLWPAIWLLPTHEEYGGWPVSGEIDILESRGNNDLKDEQNNEQGNTRMGATMHWGPITGVNRYDLTTGEKHDDFGDSFHKYAIEWNMNSVTFSVDHVVLFTTDPGTSFWDFGGFEESVPGIDNPWVADSKMAPFDRPFYMILNVAVGGTNGYFSDTWTNAGYPKPWLNTSPTGPKDFWDARANWYPTWNADVNNGEDAAMKINSIRVYKMSQDDVLTKRY